MLGLTAILVGAAATASLLYASTSSPRSLVRRWLGRYIESLDTALRGASLRVRAVSIALAQGCGAIAAAAGHVMLGSRLLLYVAISLLLAPPLALRVAAARRRRRLDDQVPTFTLALANALRTTGSIGDALRATASITPAPLRDEMELALKHVRVGSSVDDALVAAAERAKAPALDIVVSALLIGRRTGGDMARILEETAASLRELKRLEGLMARTRQNALQALAIAASITAGLALLLPSVIPSFFDPLKTTVKGQVVAGACALVYAAALYLGYRMTRTNV